jgi:DNA-binding protein HU-beta
MATRPASAKPTPPRKASTQKPPARNPPAGAPKKAAAAAQVTLKAVFEQLAETHELPKKQALAVMADLVATLTTHLKQGTKIRLSGLGTLEVRQRAARTGRNPATGEAIQIKASKKIAFRAAKELKAAV